MGIHSRETLTRNKNHQHHAVHRRPHLPDHRSSSPWAPWPAPCHGKRIKCEACPSPSSSDQEHCRACHCHSTAFHPPCSCQSSRPGRHPCQRGTLHSVCTDQRGLCQGSQGRFERTSGGQGCSHRSSPPSRCSRSRLESPRRPCRSTDVKTAGGEEITVT